MVAVVLCWLAGGVVWRVVISGVCHCCCVVLAGGSCRLACCNTWCVCRRCCNVFVGGACGLACCKSCVFQRCCGVLAGGLCALACCNTWCVSTLLWCVGWRAVLFGVL